MEIWEILLIGVALSLDAFAVGITDGMVEPNMRTRKALAVAFFFGLFQFGMPLIGYYLGTALTGLVQKIAPYLSFGLLLLLGGKMIFDGVKEKIEARKEFLLRPYLITSRKPLGIGELLMQSVATSLDALAVGVTFLAADTGAGLPFHVALCSLIVGVVTLSLSVIAVTLGKKAAGRTGGSAVIPGGVVLIAIGLKILLEGIL
ncbi:MAG: manganese efflux pump MntP family protein [Clostridia bacterium]|nr:manganese efflux pump MntP family protein [Clostridia bacterium]